MIRFVNPKDSVIAREIFDIQQAAYLQESLLIDYPNLPPLLETLADIQAANEIFLTYAIENKITGVLSYEIQDNTLTITRLVVRPDFTGRGIGQALLKEVLQHSTVNHFIVGTAEKNIPAIKLYEKYGFTILEKQTLPDGLVLVCLEKHQP
jgi:ribosomal protein S18 acetylase RimI-like enzyme